ncbi:MAG: putative 3-hydroxyisobutyrate dehydrogenase [Marmoricola sp.]|nr:putative 3-hydroxyisobutyrate dehydrogenase [Marmoricola sp.]
MSQQTVAVLGLGNMGGPMAANLAAAGYHVVGYDPVPAANEAAVARGVEVVPSAVEAVADASVVITMLPSGGHVIDAYKGPDGILAAAAPGTVFVDCSTIAVEDARAAAELAHEAGHRALDAPVSGGVGGAEAGTLTLMIGGSETDLDAVRPVLEVVSGRLVHCGESGAGQAAKICNNMILGISMIAVSEAFVLGERLGLSHQALFDVASTASGQCWALTTNCPVPGPVPTSPANRDYQPGFASPLMLKDLKLAMQAADSTSTEARIGALAAAIYTDFAFGPGRELDFSAVVQDIRDRSQSGD